MIWLLVISSFTCWLDTSHFSLMSLDQKSFVQLSLMDSSLHLSPGRLTQCYSIRLHHHSHPTPPKLTKNTQSSYYHPASDNSGKPSGSVVSDPQLLTVPFQRHQPKFAEQLGRWMGDNNNNKDLISVASYKHVLQKFESDFKDVSRCRKGPSQNCQSMSLSMKTWKDRLFCVYQDII